MTLSEVLTVLWARRRRFLLTLTIVLLLTAAVCLFMPPVYTGEASVLLDTTGRDPLFGTELNAGQSGNNVATQMDVIGSHNVALKVVDRFKLTESPQLQQQFETETDGQGNIRNWLADKVLSRLTLVPGRDSNVITLQFRSGDRNSASELANAFAEGYIQTTLELNMDLSRQQANWFDDQLRQLRGNLEDVQKRLSDYQQNKNIVSTDERLDVENGKLAEITSQLVVAQTTMFDTKTRLRQMNLALDKGQVAQLPDILNNSLLQSMKADLSRLQAKLAETAERYGRNHPHYISAQAEVRTMEAKLAAELETAKGSINQLAQIAEQRVNELQAAQEKQKSRILALKDQRNGSDVLNKEVESAQKAYEVAAQRANEVRMASQLNQSNVTILSHAVPPIKAERPKPLLYSLIGIVFGGMSASVLVLWAEMNDRRARSIELVTEQTGLLVLAELPTLPRYRRRRSRGRGGKLLAAPPIAQAAH